MKLTPEQEQKFQKHMSTMQGQCQVCGSKNWSIFEQMMEMRPYEGGTLVAGGAVVPLVVTYCNKCGQTVFFSAGILGLVNSEGN